MIDTSQLNVLRASKVLRKIPAVVGRREWVARTMQKEYRNFDGSQDMTSISIEGTA